MEISSSALRSRSANLWTVILGVAVVLMALVAVPWLTKNFGMLLRAEPPWGAIDLRFRYIEVQSWFAGEPVYRLKHAMYPPASHVMLWRFLGWLAFAPTRLLWAADRGEVCPRPHSARPRTRCMSTARPRVVYTRKNGGGSCRRRASRPAASPAPLPRGAFLNYRSEETGTMADRDSAFVGSIPRNCHHYLGPILFHHYTTIMMERRPEALADIKEVVARNLAAQLGDSPLRCHLGAFVFTATRPLG